MAILKWITENYPVTLNFLGLKWIRSTFEPVDVFLAQDPGEDEIFDFLKTGFEVNRKNGNKIFREMVVLACLNIRPECYSAEYDLRVLEISLRKLLKVIKENKLRAWIQPLSATLIFENF